MNDAEALSVINTEMLGVMATISLPKAGLVKTRSRFPPAAAVLASAAALLLLPGSLQANGSAGASVTLLPDSAGASGVRWTVRIVTPYCGGYRVGRYVALRFLPPFVLPAAVPPDAVTFADGPATVTRTDNVLQIAPAPGRIWSMVCGTDLPLEIVLSQGAGLKNPGKPGTYTIVIDTEADPKPVRVTVVVRAARP